MSEPGETGARAYNRSGIIIRNLLGINLAFIARIPQLHTGDTQCLPPRAYLSSVVSLMNDNNNGRCARRTTPRDLHKRSTSAPRDRTININLNILNPRAPRTPRASRAPAARGGRECRRTGRVGLKLIMERGCTRSAHGHIAEARTDRSTGYALSTRTRRSACLSIKAKCILQERRSSFASVAQLSHVPDDRLRRAITNLSLVVALRRLIADR